MDSSKRWTLQTLAGLGALVAMPRVWAQARAAELRDIPMSRSYDLTVAETTLNVTGRPAHRASPSTARCQAPFFTSVKATRW